MDRLLTYLVKDTNDNTLESAEYSYEGYNRKTEVVEENGVLVKSRSYDYNQLNWLTKITDSTDPENIKTITYTYDNNGNTLSKSDSSRVNQDMVFTYDSLNQLTRTTRGPPGSETVLGEYDYNASGLRVRHRYSDRGDVDYYYDDNAVIEEHNASNDSILAHYRYADRLISLDTGSSVQYYHHDALGSTVNLTNNAGSTQVSYKLDPWGHIKDQQGTSINRQIFTQQEHDNNTNLIYFGARYYDPDTARFITQDSYLGESNTPPSLHRYLYAYSNPIVYIDLDGYETVYRDPKTDKVYWGVQRYSNDLETIWHEVGIFKKENGKPLVYLTEEYGNGVVAYPILSDAAHDFWDRKGTDEKSVILKSNIYDLPDNVQKGFIASYIDFKLNPHNELRIMQTPEKSFFDEWINPLDDLYEDYQRVKIGDMQRVDFAGKWAYEAMIAHMGGEAGSQIFRGLKGPVARRIEKWLGNKADDIGRGIEEGLESFATKSTGDFGRFKKKFAKDLKRLGVGEDQRCIILENIRDNFTDYANVKISRITRERSFWRRWGGDNAFETGRYGASGHRTAAYTRSRLAVKKAWNSLEFETRFRIKKGGLLIEGPTAPKIDVGGKLLHGEGHQLYVPNVEDLYIEPLR